MSRRPPTLGPVVEIDMKKLHKAIHRRLYFTDKTAAETALLLGFTPQVFSDIKATALGTPGRTTIRRNNGSANYRPSADVLASILWWLGSDLSDFTTQVRPIVRPATVVEDE